MIKRAGVETVPDNKERNNCSCLIAVALSQVTHFVGCDVKICGFRVAQLVTEISPVFRSRVYAMYIAQGSPAGEHATEAATSNILTEARDASWPIVRARDSTLQKRITNGRSSTANLRASETLCKAPGALYISIVPRPKEPSIQFFSHPAL